MRRNLGTRIAAALSILVPVVFAGCSGSTQAPKDESSGGSAVGSGGLAATSGGTATQQGGGGGNAGSGGNGGATVDECVANVAGCQTVYYRGDAFDLKCRSLKIFTSVIDGFAACLVSPSCTNGCLDKVYSCSDPCIERTRLAISSSCTLCNDDLLCTSLATDGANCGSCGKTCKTGTRCEDGACGACAGGLTDCGAACTNLNADPANCGTCGNACQPNQACTQGKCISGP